MHNVTKKSSTRKTTSYILTDTRIRKATQAEEQSLPTPGSVLVCTHEPEYQPLIINGFEC